MGFRFRRSVKIAPGIRLNFGKKGISTTIGPRGAKMTFGKDGVRQTVGLPGTGLSYTSNKKYDQASSQSIPYTPTCPYCGHNMRKTWANCPKCGNNLLPIESTEQSEPTVKPPASSSFGCGCLIAIIVFILVLIYLL